MLDTARLLRVILSVIIMTAFLFGCNGFQSKVEPRKVTELVPELKELRSELEEMCLGDPLEDDCINASRAAVDDLAFGDEPDFYTCSRTACYCWDSWLSHDCHVMWINECKKYPVPIPDSGGVRKCFRRNPGAPTDNPIPD